MNFGWGRNAGDNLAREGTWYIDPAGVVTGAAPKPEAGFVQPVAQFGREGALLVAVTGSVSSTASFTNITALFGDLDSGKVLALIGAPGTPSQTVYRANLVDSALASVTLAGLAGGRPDPVLQFPEAPPRSAGTNSAFYRDANQPVSPAGPHALLPHKLTRSISSLRYGPANSASV